MLPPGDSRTLCLVRMGIDGQSRRLNVMAISRPDDLGDPAWLSGLTLDITLVFRSNLGLVEHRLIGEIWHRVLHT
jgi:hypothetical protein